MLVRAGFGAALAALLADVLGRALGWGALGPGDPDPHPPRVALSFDDGPSAQTPALLRVLAQHGVKATFFVTQPACRAFPHELHLIRQAGHQLEAHGRWHRHALLLPPWREWAQIRWHPRAHEQASHAPLLYRPPYGGHSPFTRLLAALLQRHVTLWDVESRDWTPGQAPELARQTLRQLRAGSIVLLHDGPSVTPDLLDHLLTEAAREPFGFVTLRDLPPRRITLQAGLARLRRSYGLSGGRPNDGGSP